VEKLADCSQSEVKWLFMDALWRIMSWIHVQHHVKMTTEV